MATKQVETVSDYMRTLEDEIAAIKSGELSENKGRVIFRGRALQLQAAALNLQYKRLNRGNSPQRDEGELKLITVAKTAKEEKKEPEPKT